MALDISHVQGDWVLSFQGIASPHTCSPQLIFQPLDSAPRETVPEMFHRGRL